MVNKKTAEGSNLPAIGIITKENDNDEVHSIFCKICKEYYIDDESGRSSLDNLVGNVRKVVLN